MMTMRLSNNAPLAGKLLLIGIVAGLFGCAALPETSEKRADQPLVFPGPPDEPRFVYERTIYGSTDIVPEAADFRLKSMLTGEARGGEGLAKPYGIAVRRGRVYVSDSVARHVKVFDIPAGRYFKVGDEDGAGKLQQPLGLDVDQNGVLYVADNTGRTVRVYDREGKFLKNIGSSKTLVRPASVTVDPAGDRLYVVDIGGVTSEEHKIRVFDARNGERLYDIGKRGKGPGEFNLPRDTAIGADGLLYVVDGGNFRVQVLKPDGAFVREFGGTGRQFGQFARPKEIAVDPSGNVYVADAAFGNFQIFSPRGDLLLFVGSRSEQDGPAKYMLPAGIAVDEDGRVYFADQWFRKIDVFRPASLQLEAGFVRPPSGPAKP